VNKKKDLTRIEDLGQYLHELDHEEEVPSLPEETTDFSEESFSSDEAFDSTSSFQTTEFEAEEPPSEDFVPEEGALLPETNLDFGTQEESFPVSEVHEEDSEPFTEERSEWRPEEDHHKPVEHEYKTPETFEDLKRFSESSSFTGMATEGNPSFSVLLKDVKYIEDVNDILILLKDLNLLFDSEEQIKARLMRGSLLIPRISEYAAIFLAHKLRRFDVDIQVGLSDEIHPPRHQEAPEVGIVSRHNLYQNQSHHFSFEDQKLELSQIIVAATPTLDQHQIVRYLGIATEHTLLDEAIVDDEASEEVPRHYHELAQRLKAHALKHQANAVVGLSYQLNPVGNHKYRLTCTGNLVWVNKL
jgi:uncharacterized protein YbjQ (UPF0145 family)